MGNGSSLLTIRNRHFFILDIILSIIAAILSFAIRLEGIADHDAWKGIVLFLIIAIPLRLFIFIAFRIYSRYWLNAGPSELLMLIYACASSSLIVTLSTLAITAQAHIETILPHSIPLIDSLLITLMVLVERFSFRAFRYQYTHYVRRLKNHAQPAQRVLIIGAGHTGLQVLDALEHSDNGISVCGFLDDDSVKVGSFVRGRKVLGKTEDLVPIVRSSEATLVVIAIPSANGNFVRHIVSDCLRIGVAYKIIPGMYELVSGKISVNSLRSVAIDDLLRRTPVSLDTNDIEQQLRDRCVMVTGAGGSIGAELARQIAKYQPGRLLLLGHGENSLFSIENRLKNEFPGLQQKTFLADIRDLNHMTRIFQQERPDFVFHAAAHKHVPMLESNIVEGVMNNVVGTRNLIELCNRFEVRRMVLISSDKAVKPTNVMGMSKRTAELLMIQAANDHPKRFTAVRFGNVLGSRGSVVPIFEQQIVAGGPITITSSEMTRYFMSIPEASLLVLKASVLPNYGPLFVLNMGNAVRILDLAHDLIRLSGLVPDRDIEIKITGLRPGEKLHEELYWHYETHTLIENDAIYAIELPDMYLRQIMTEMPNRLQTLIEAAQRYDTETVRGLLKKIVFELPTVNVVIEQEKHLSEPVKDPSRQDAPLFSRASTSNI